MAKILLADDSATAQNMGRNILSDAGHEVLTVSSAAAALAELPEFQPDVLVLDIYMQGSPAGLDLCEQLRTRPGSANLPILLAVGKMEPHDPADAERTGADAVIVKPFEATELIAKIKQMAELAATRPKPDYSRLHGAVPQLWPAAAVAKFLAPQAVSTTANPVAGTQAEEVGGPDHDRIATTLQKVLADRLPGIIAEVIAELRSDRAGDGG